MKLLAVRLARAIWLIPPYFFNPKGLYMDPMLLGIKNRYSFRTSPLDRQTPPSQNEGYKFEDGVYNVGGRSIHIMSMTLHDDGVVVDSRSSTTDCDAFLEETIDWCSKEYGLATASELPIRKIYASELNVTYTQPPAIISPKLRKFIDEVTLALGGSSTDKADLLMFALATDQTKSKTTATFRFDREANTPIKDHRYYSFAPTTTDVHIKLLEKLDD